MKAAICSALLFALVTFFGANAFGQPPQTQPRPTRMNHLALQVKDLAKSTHFYMHVVGLDSLPEPFRDGRHVWLSLGNTSHLHLISLPGSTPIIPGKSNHLCFSVASIDLFLKELEKNKIAYEDWPGKSMSVTTRVDGVHQLYLQDPDGYWIEINDARE
jgi:lactoylglutathione lyase